MILYLDTETFSETPIADGVHKYAEASEIMIVSWAIDDGPVQVYDRTGFGKHIPASGSIVPAEVEKTLADPETIVVMHNSNFDRTLLRHHYQPIPASRIHDTDAQARAHGLPGSLEKLCDIMKVPDDLRKHSGGKDMIRIFCKPQPKNSKVRRRSARTDPDKWQQFLEYAGGDIHSMRWLYKQMPRWNYPNREHGLWVLDQAINDRGFKVDLALAHGAIEAVKLVKTEKDAETKELTDGVMRSTQQRDKLLQTLLFEFGVALPDMQSGTIERRLEDPNLPPAVKELLANRLMVSAASTAKYNKIVRGVSKDGRMRGTLLYSGAGRTKRWSGRLFQPQNLPRPDMAQEEIAFSVDAFRANVGYWLLNDPMRAAWNCLRGLIVADEGKKIVQADLAGIEARILPWLAKEQWKLQAFRDLDAGIGEDIYRQTAAKMLGISVEEVTKPQRQSHGKHPELACGYGGAKGSLFAIAKLFKYDIGDAEAFEIVRMWRSIHPAIADWDTGFWKQLDHAARQAIAQPGKVFAAGDYIHFEVWKSWMKMHLPSGGFLSYASPKIIPDTRMGGDTVSFMGINNYTRKWERITTYGGKLSADATQSTAREILAYNLQHIEDEGYPIVLQVHDEVITEPDDDPAFSVDRLVSLLTRRPPWIDDHLPLAAGGFEAYRYRKDD